MLFTIRRRSQVSLFLARVGRTCTLDLRVTSRRIELEKSVRNKRLWHKHVENRSQISAL